jgi:beta-fructofuranosidase
MPDFFPLGDTHLVLSSRGKTWWHQGEYSNGTFQIQQHSAVDGENFYAAKTTLDDKGRRLMWGWIKETRSDETQRVAGWSGVLSLPRVLSWQQ